jgi:SNF family Na+-dependent transporter
MAKEQPSVARPKEQWGTRIGVILAVAGSAVGLGNFLRFPGQAAQNGGGAFMLPYFVALLVLGIPMCWAEWAMGRYSGVRGFNSAPGIFSVIWPNRLAKYFGALALLIPLVIYMYYVLIEAWCLGYAYDYLVGNLPLAPTATSEEYGAYFNDFVGANSDGFIYQGGNSELVFILMFTFVLNFVLIYRGVTRGIERFCNFAIPLMAVCAICVLIRVLTLGTPDPAKPDLNLINGLGSMWNPNSEYLYRSKTWLAAAGQIFFSISAGFGIIINYASYLRRKDDIALSGLTACSVNEFFEVCLGGLITLPAAFIFLGVAATTQGTFGLGFNALPNVFAEMPGGRFFGFVWFFMLFLAAITSSLSMLQPVIAFFEEGLGLKRHASVAFLGLVAALGTGFVVYFSKGLVALDTFDFWVGTFLIYTLAMFQTIVYGWIFGIQRGEQELAQGAQLRVPRLVQYVLKYVSPVFLLVIFATFFWQEVPSKLEPLFESKLTAAQLIDESVPAALQAELAEQGHTLPAQTKLVADTEVERWSITTMDGTTLFVLAEEQDSAGEDVVAVHAYKMGYFETVWRNVVATMAVGFIFTIFVFLLVLVHIAGQRWENEGRITYGRT